MEGKDERGRRGESNERRKGNKRDEEGEVGIKRKSRDNARTVDYTEGRDKEMPC